MIGTKEQWEAVVRGVGEVVALNCVDDGKYWRYDTLWHSPDGSFGFDTVFVKKDTPWCDDAKDAVVTNAILEMTKAPNAQAAYLYLIKPFYECQDPENEDINTFVKLAEAGLRKFGLTEDPMPWEVESESDRAQS
jgi:hypothetical protein